MYEMNSNTPCVSLIWAFQIWIKTCLSKMAPNVVCLEALMVCSLAETLNHRTMYLLVTAGS